MDSSHRAVAKALGRRALHVTAAGVTASLVCVAATSNGPVLPTAIAVRSLTIPVALTAAIGESPTTVGVADSDLYQLSEVEIGVTLDRLKTLGVNDIRVAVPWVYIQPSSSASYDWTKMDIVARAAAERDMNVVGVISGTPAWAGFPINGHSDPDDYARFAAAVADRYQEEIGHYEIWNEPNGALFYNPVSAAAYTAMLRAAYPAIKAADPDAVVVAGVLGSVETLAGLSLRPQTFVSQMYEAGAQGHFDALSFHPYHYTLPFSRGETVTNSPVNQVAAIRALMTAHGDGDLKIWVTEYGLPTNPQISEAQQAAFIRDFVVTWQSVDGAGPIFIYSTRDSASGSFDDENNFGLHRTDWTPKQAAAAVQDLIEDLADGTAEPFDITPYLPQNSFVDNLFIVARQIASLLLIVPRALVQLVTSAVQAVVQTIGTVVGQLLGHAPAGDEPAVQAARIAEEPAEPVSSGAQNNGHDDDREGDDREDNDQVDADEGNQRRVAETPVEEEVSTDEVQAAEPEEEEPTEVAEEPDTEADDTEADDTEADDTEADDAEAGEVDTPADSSPETKESERVNTL